MSLLEKDIIRKKHVDKKNIIELGASNNDSREYKKEIICNKTVYAEKSKLSHLLELYYLIFIKDYLEKENN